MSCFAVLIPLVLMQAESPADEQRTQRWMDFYAKVAGEYRLYREGEQELPLETESIFKYTNAERERGQHGAVFVWKYQGRPEAIGTIWSIRNRLDSTKRRTAHEFHSLSLSRLRSERPEIIGLGQKGKLPQWRPTEPGIKLNSFPTDPRPSSAGPARLVQMRGLAREFDAVSIAESGRQDLRLLPQPLVRYQSPSSGVVDGALFAMVSGTDPELLLLIELREIEGTLKWQFAPARLTGRPLRLRLKQQTVWQCEKAQTWVGHLPYFFCVGVSEHDAEGPGQLEE